MPDFEKFPKIPRLSRDIIITEKIDGTNAQVFIDEEGNVLAGSRKRWLTPGKEDNFGFAAWVEANKSELLKLGPGRHYGEWWGKGIQRGYGLPDRRFSLFNVGRWGDPLVRPACCYAVPVLYQGPFSEGAIDNALEDLEMRGSWAVPFLDPEGIVIFHTAGNYLFKKTIKDDEKPKGVVEDG